MPLTVNGLPFELFLRRPYPQVKEHKNCYLVPLVVSLLQQGPKTSGELVRLVNGKLGRDCARSVQNALTLLRQQGKVAATRRMGVQGRSFTWRLLP